MPPMKPPLNENARADAASAPKTASTRNERLLAVGGIVGALMATLLAIGLPAPASAAADDHASAREQKGPHGGRLLEHEDGFNLEITIAERGIPPEFRVYPRRDATPLPVEDVAVEIRLRRITGLPDGTVDHHQLVPAGDWLRSPDTVYEPHAFTVAVSAVHAGKRYRWQYDSPEGRVDIAADKAGTFGLRTAAATAGEIRETRSLYGRIAIPEDRQWTVGARFPGLVQSVAVRSGDGVRKGQVLARVESSDSLRSYAVTAPADGVVQTRLVNPGELTSGAMFRLIDPSEVWAELQVFPGDQGRVQAGAPVRVWLPTGDTAMDGTLAYLSPTADDNQARHARVIIDNRDGRWPPGAHVEAEVTIHRRDAPLVVPEAAVQTFRDWEVVFVREGIHYQALPVTLGARDREHVEILDGLLPGADVVTDNAYLLKADLEKSGAAHDH